jgi:hypothetical protein
MRGVRWRGRNLFDRQVHLLARVASRQQAQGNDPAMVKRQGGTSHRILERPGWSDILFAYHDRVTLGPTAVKILAKKTGLTPRFT